MRDHPAVVLTRHFFTSLFDFGVLSEEGAESLKRVLLGGLALAIAGGLLLARVFMAKYGALAGAGPEAYQRAVAADHAFLMALPMWIVASAMALVGQAIFPDETDFRILMAQPLTRPVVFGAKLAALLLFGGLLVAGTHVGLAPLGALTLIGAGGAGAIVATAAALAVSSMTASLFAALGVIALQGVLVLVASRRRLLAFSGTVRILVVGGLVLALPLVTRLPATAGAFETQAWWLPWVPPAWFAGLERWLLGDATHAALAAQAVAATAGAFAISVLAYVTLYRRFDRLTFQAGGPGHGRRRDPAMRVWGRLPVRGAVRRFVALTIRRSVLHLGLVVGLLAASGGVVLNSLLSANWQDEPGALQGVAGVLLWAPLTMVFLAVPAIRLALSIPMELRANWVFRMAEDVDGRAEVADASVRTVLALAVVIPLALFAPLQWSVLGPGVAPVLLVEGAVGWLLVERRMREWHRVPFTCAYLPGKGFVPQMCVKAFAAYVVFTLATGVALRLSLRSAAFSLALTSALVLTSALLRRRRNRVAKDTCLRFEEQLPTELTPLRLNAE